MNKAFTLIEVLVVVLIIGILSAIALPQYQLTVEKARAAEALINLRAIADANRRYHLANGEYTYDITLLDIDLPGQDYTYNQMPRRKNSYFDFGARRGGKTSLDGSIAIVNRLPMDDDKSYFLIAYEDGSIMCLPNNNPPGTMAQKICKALNVSTL